MNIHKYIQWSVWIRAEIIESLTQEDRCLVEADLRSLGRSAWLSWIDEHIDEVCEYVEATAIQRSRRKVWRDDPGHRLRIALAACLVLPGTTKLMDEAIAVSGVGSGYRAHVGYSCSAWFRIYCAPFPFWPFDEDDQFCGFDFE